MKENEQIPAAARAIVVGPNEGRTLTAFGDTIQVKLGREQTGGSLMVAMATIPPGGGPPSHRHLQEDEMALILEGQCEFFADGERIEAGPGSLIYTPRGVVHTFKNIGETVGRAWVITTPCGFEEFFGKCAVMFEETGGGPPDMSRLLNICAEHGIEFVAPASMPPSPAPEGAV